MDGIDRRPSEESLGSLSHIPVPPLPPPPDLKRVMIPWTRKLLVVFAAVVALTASTGIGISLGVHRRNPEVARWKSSSELFQAESAKAQALANQNKTSWQDTLSQLYRAKGDLADIQGKVRDAVVDLNHPSFVTWNAPTRLSPGGYLVASVPDTFTFKAELRSTAPIKLMIMTVQDFACWRTRVCASHWVEWSSVYPFPSVLNLHQLVRGHWISAVFHKAEGCAAYVAVITGSGLVVPEVTATRNPAHHLTGACQ